MIGGGGSLEWIGGGGGDETASDIENTWRPVSKTAAKQRAAIGAPGFPPLNETRGGRRSMNGTAVQQ